jgi:hypothetical protein
MSYVGLGEICLGPIGVPIESQLSPSGVLVGSRLGPSGVPVGFRLGPNGVLASHIRVPTQF